MIIPPKKQIAEITRDLVNEIGRASNIKDKNNMNTVIEAQSAARERLKNYQRAPNNGLILFSGRVALQGCKT
jgi:peptide chain release factor subunit 1